MKISALSLLIPLLVFSASTAAFEFRVVKSTTGVKNINTSNHYDVLDAVVAPSIVKAYINFNEQVGTLYFEINAKKRSKLRLEYDNDDLLFSQFTNPNELTINAPGEATSVNFTVFGPVSGSIKIFNEKNQLLKTVAYIVRKEGRYRHSLSGNLSNTKTEVLEDETNTTSLSYSISKKTEHSADPYWNLGASVSADIDNPDKRTVNVGFDYTW